MSQTVKGLIEIIESTDLSSREKGIVVGRLGDRSLDDLAEKYGVSRERIRQIESTAVRRLKFPMRVGLASVRRVKFQAAQAAGVSGNLVSKGPELLIDEIVLPLRVVNNLKKAGISTVSRLCGRSVTDLLRIKNIGVISVSRIEQALREVGARLALDVY